MDGKTGTSIVYMETKDDGRVPVAVVTVVFLPAMDELDAQEASDTCADYVAGEIAFYVRASSEFDSH